jgi:hypothetical protein
MARRGFMDLLVIPWVDKTIAIPQRSFYRTSSVCAHFGLPHKSFRSSQSLLVSRNSRTENTESSFKLRNRGQKLP